MGSGVKPLKRVGVSVQPFRAANCAFGVDWNKNFITTHEGKPLKNIALTYNNHFSKGELVISKFGLEGNAIYALKSKDSRKTAYRRKRCNPCGLKADNDS